MTGYLFAMPPSVVLIQEVGVAVVVLVAALFAWFRHARGKGRPGLGLAWVALASGPLVGLLFAWLYFSLENVNPLDVGYFVYVHVFIGGFAGCIAAASFGIIALMKQSPQPSKPTRDVWDKELDGP